MFKILLLLVALPFAQIVYANIGGDGSELSEPALVMENMPQSGVWIPQGDYIESCLPVSATDGNPYCVRNHVSDYRRCKVTRISPEGHVVLVCGNTT